VTTPKDKRGGQPGRKTNQQIIEDFLQQLDLPPEVVAAIRGADARLQVTPSGTPGSFTEMRDLAAQEIWTRFKSLQGTAQVQAFNAIRELAKQDPNGGDDSEPEPLIADIVAGVASLSAVRKRQILTDEREKLRAELDAIEGVLAEMDQAVAA
jgi:hypothetical protein